MASLSNPGAKVRAFYLFGVSIRGVFATLGRQEYSALHRNFQVESLVVSWRSCFFNDLNATAVVLYGFRCMVQTDFPS